MNLAGQKVQSPAGTLVTFRRLAIADLWGCQSRGYILYDNQIFLKTVARRIPIIDKELQIIWRLSLDRLRRKS